MYALTVSRYGALKKIIHDMYALTVSRHGALKEIIHDMYALKLYFRQYPAIHTNYS